MSVTVAGVEAGAAFVPRDRMSGSLDRTEDADVGPEDVERVAQQREPADGSTGGEDLVGLLPTEPCTDQAAAVEHPQRVVVDGERRGRRTDGCRRDDVQLC